MQSTAPGIASCLLVASGLALSGGQRSNGPREEATPDDGSAAEQHWKIEPCGGGLYKLSAPGADRVLAASSSDDGPRVSLAPWSGKDEQKRELLDVPELTM